MGKAFVAAQSYNPSRGTKFSTWVYRPWANTIKDKEFLRVKRLTTTSISYTNDPDKQLTLEHKLEDKKSSPPSDYFKSNVLKRKNEVADHLFQWICPFCRKVVLEYLLCQHIKTKEVAFSHTSVLDVYARRAFWKESIQRKSM